MTVLLILAGLTLTFTDGSKLDLNKAGNAANTHDILFLVELVKAEGVTVQLLTNTAQTGLDFFGEDTGLGFEWHSAADFLS